MSVLFHMSTCLGNTTIKDLARVLLCKFIRLGTNFFVIQRLKFAFNYCNKVELARGQHGIIHKTFDKVLLIIIVIILNV